MTGVLRPLSRPSSFEGVRPDQYSRRASVFSKRRQIARREVGAEQLAASLEKNAIFIKIPGVPTEEISISVFGQVFPQCPTVKNWHDLIGERHFCYIPSFAFTINPVVRFKVLLNQVNQRRGVTVTASDVFEEIKRQPFGTWAGKFKPQVDFLRDGHNNLGLDLIGRCEERDYHLIILAETIGRMSPIRRVDMPVLAESLKDLSREDLRNVESHYQEDFVSLGYSL